MSESFRRVNPLWPMIRFTLLNNRTAPHAHFRRFRNGLDSTQAPGPIAWGRAFVGRDTASACDAVLHRVAVAMARAAASGCANPSTLVIFFLSIVFPILSIAALAVTARSGRFHMNRAVRIHSLLVAIACVGISGYVGYWY